MDTDTFEQALHSDKEKDRKMGGNEIISPRLPPRRVWDLYANRVVPSWSAFIGERVQIPQSKYANLVRVLQKEDFEEMFTNWILRQWSSTLALGETSFCPIPSALADTTCTHLGTDELGLFCVLLHIPYDEKDAMSTMFRTVLDTYITQNRDVGTVYASLHPYHFYHFYLYTGTFEQALRFDEEKDREIRQNAIIEDRIPVGDIPPRRVWDLCANRVVPYWVACSQSPLSLWAISHAWMDDKDLKHVWTPINGYEWPVPVPKDANLNLIRIEMLNLGAEYVWLDVLCLRQPGGPREDLRAEEWKLDVPTIGQVYQKAKKVVCYFIGLGRPLHLKPGDLESKRSWFRRAWTLQEITANPIIGGQTTDNSSMGQELQQRLAAQLKLLQQMWTKNSVVDMLSEMEKRVSTKPMDRVAGLAYLLKPKHIPIYHVEQSEESAWGVLVDAILPPHRRHLFFLYPEPGKGDKYWRPSWEQAMTQSPSLCCWSLRSGTVGRTEEMDDDWYKGPRIDLGNLRGLANTSPSGDRRRGELVVKGDNDMKHTIPVFAHHQYTIPDGSYTLIGSRGKGLKYIWVVGRNRPDGKFEKLSVLMTKKRLKLERGRRNVLTHLC